MRSSRLIRISCGIAFVLVGLLGLKTSEDVAQAQASRSAGDRSLAIYQDGPRTLGQALRMEYALTAPDSMYCRTPEPKNIIAILQQAELPPDHCGATVLYGFLRLYQIPALPHAYQGTKRQRQWLVARATQLLPWLRFERLNFAWFQAMPAEPEVNLQALDRISRD